MRWQIPRWLRTRAGVVFLLTLVVGLAAVVSLAADIGRPFGGYFSLSFADSEAGQLDRRMPTWGSMSADRFVPAGEFVTIEGLPYRRHARDVFADRMPGDLVELGHAEAWGAPASTVMAPVMAFTFSHYLDIKLPQLIVAVCFWLLAIMVLRAQPDATTNQVFAVLTSIIAAHTLLNGHTLFIDTRPLPNLLESGLLAVSAFIGATTFHFAWVYPTPLEKAPRRLITALYLTGLLLALVHIFERFPWWPAGVPQPTYPFTWHSFQLMLFLLALGTATLIGRLIYSIWRQNNTPRQRRVLVLTGVGVLAALPMILLYLTELVPRLYVPPIWRQLDLRLLLVGTAMALALAIVRYQSVRSPSRLFVLVAILAGSAFLATGLAWLWLILQPPAIVDQILDPFLPLFLGIFLASLFWSFQTTWRGWLGRIFQRDDSNYNATRDFGRRINQNVNLRSLPATIAQAIVDELGLTGAAVWLADPEMNQYHLAARAGEATAPLPVDLPVPAAWPTQPFFRLPSNPLPDWLSSLAGSKLLEVVVPLHDDDGPVALLGFGRRWDEEVFDERDLTVIELIGQQAVLYLQVARQNEELRQVSQRVDAAQERERTRLAAELHDTIQQFLGRLPFFLATSKETMAENPDEAARLLDRCLSDIEEAASTVQQIRHNLAPSRLNYSLTESLAALVHHTRSRHAVDVPLAIHGDIDTATVLETRHALYRVVQHALDNAVAHADADRIDVKVRRVDGLVWFTITDDGRGSSVEERERAHEDGHFGLLSMRNRIESCGGELSFQSAPGQGTRITGWVPAQTPQEH